MTPFFYAIKIFLLIFIKKYYIIYIEKIKKDN